MNLFFRNTMARPGAIIAFALAATLSGGAAHAAGTAAGTAITNLATLTYSVGGTAQNPIGSSETGNLTGAGTATSFLVDNKVNLTVLRDSSTFVSVVPGTNGVTSFTVTNTGNSVQDFSLSAANLAGGSLSGVTDNFDTGTCSVKVESGTTAGYQALEDTATFIDELAPDASKTVYVVCAIPLSRVDGDGAVISLTAEARVGGTPGGTVGAALTQTTGANTTGVDIVFADIAGTDDAARDAKHSARDVFKVVTAKLTVTKTVTPVCDPMNGDANPKNIPGSFVRYTISIANTGNDTATLTQITDTLNTTLVTFDANLITGVGTAAPATTCSAATGTATSAAGSGFKVDVTGSTRTGYPKYYTSTSSVDGIDFVTPNITADFSLVLPNEGGYLPGHLKKNETVSVIYQVKIN